MNQMVQIGGSARDREVINAVSALMRPENGPRLLGKIRFACLPDEPHTITGYLGDRNGPAMDLRKDAVLPDDERARQVRKALESFSDDELASAMSLSIAWDFAMIRTCGPDGVATEHIADEEGFAQETIKEVASLAEKVR